MLSVLFILAAAPAAPVDACRQKEASQMQMNACAEQQFDRADRALNATFAKARAFARDRQALRLLLDSQRAWLKYRDAECALDADEDRGGSIAPQAERECLTDLTRERTKDLAEFAKAWKAR